MQHKAIVPQGQRTGSPGEAAGEFPNGADPLTKSVAEFTDFIRKDIEKWRKVVSAPGVQFDG